MVLENGVEIGMDYNTVLALIGTPNQVWSDTMAGMGMERLGVMYDFHYDENLVMRLHNISFRFAEDTSTGITSALPAARGIALGEAMQSVFSKMPAMIRRLKSGPYRKFTAGQIRPAARRRFPSLPTASIRSIS